MPARISIECTHCGAKLNLADSSKLGKKIKCPKCSEVFVASSDDDLDDEEIEEVEDDADDQEDDDEPALPRGKKGAATPGAKKGAAAKGGKGKKGKGKNSGSNLGLIIGGSVGAVVLLLGLVGVLYATGAFGAAKLDPNQIQVNPTPGAGIFSSLLKEQAAAAIPARSPIPDVAKWLPPDSEFVLHIRPADIMGSPLVKDLLKSMQLEDQVNQTSAGWGIQPADIESFTIGVAQVEKAQQQIQQAQLAMMMGGQPQLAAINTPSLAVIQLKKPVTYDALLKLAEQVAEGQPVQKVQHAGKEYLESTDPKTSVKGGAYLATDTVIVLGDSANLKTAIEKGAATQPVPNFGFMDWTDHLTLAYAPKNADELKKQISQGSQANPMLGLALGPIAEGASGFSIGLTVKGGVEAEVAVGCVDLAKMEAITKSLTDLTGVGRGQYDQNKKQIPPWAQPLTDFLVSNLKVTGSNRVVVVTTNIPDSAQQQLAQLPAMIMTQVAMSAMLGGGGPGNVPPALSATPDSPGDDPSPGDSPGQPTISSDPSNATATTVKELPKGFTLNGSLRDGFHSVGPSDRALGFDLEVGYQGDGGKCRIAAVGKLKARECITGGGEAVPLKVYSSAIKSDEGDTEEWELLMNTDQFAAVSSSPGQFEFGIPVGETKPIKSIAGTFHYITGTRSKPIQIMNVLEQAGKEPADPALKTAGFRLELVKEMDTFGETDKLRISVEPGYLLTKVESIDETGSTSYDAFPDVSRDKQLQILKPGVGSLELKKGLGIRFYLYSDLKEVEVPFTFENLELPKPAKE